MYDAMYDEETIYERLAKELVDQFPRIGGSVMPLVRNTAHGEMGVIRALYMSETKTLTPSELADYVHVSSARVANILRRLEEKGLITRSHSEDDRRRVDVRLTLSGFELADDHRKRRDAAIARYLKKLGEHDASELVRITRRTGDLMEDGEAE